MANLGILKYIIFNTLIGELTVVWDDDENLFKQIILPDVVTKKNKHFNMNYHGVLYEEHPSDFIHNIMSKLKNVILGKEESFDMNYFDFSELTDFQTKVLLKQCEIPFGKVTSYKHIAQMIEKPRSARPVANVLSSNPFPIAIPCHRTVRSDWTVGGYAGSTDNTFKKFILAREGVKIEDETITEEYRYR